MSVQLRYIKEFDGIRALAALLVLVCHFPAFWPAGSLEGIKDKVAVIGQGGVSLFFSLSGFLITRILLSTKEAPGYFKNFYIRRTLRIFPLYYGFLVFYYFIYPLIAGEPFAPFVQQIYYWIFMQDFSTTFRWVSSGPEIVWSLAIEEHFYLFWPLLVFILSKRKLANSLIALIMLSTVLRLILSFNTNYQVYYFTFCRLDELSLGSLLAIVLTDRPDKRRAFSFAALFTVTAIATFALWKNYSGSSLPVIQVVKYNVVSVMFASFLGLVLSIQPGNFLARILRSGFLVFTGKISFGLYIWHWTCFVLFNKYIHIANGPLRMLATFAVTYLVATLSFYYFESYFLRFKDRFAYKTKQKPVPELHRGDKTGVGLVQEQHSF
jgi:peptidoglycan/LPS O-acetylase OafA/YrhL